jgi:hypothetical protein
MANYLCWDGASGRGFSQIDETSVVVAAGSATVYFPGGSDTSSLGGVFMVQTAFEAMRWVKEGERGSPIYGNEISNFNNSAANESLMWLIWYCFFTGQCF